MRAGLRVQHEVRGLADIDHEGRNVRDEGGVFVAAGVGFHGEDARLEGAPARPDRLPFLGRVQFGAVFLVEAVRRGRVGVRLRRRRLQVPAGRPGAVERAGRQRPVADHVAQQRPQRPGLLHPFQLLPGGGRVGGAPLHHDPGEDPDREQERQADHGQLMTDFQVL